MSAQELEIRLIALEAEVARLKKKVEADDENIVPWWEKISGTFADDPIYDEAMRLGREYRESLRPKTKKTKEEMRWLSSTPAAFCEIISDKTRRVKKYELLSYTHS